MPSRSLPEESHSGRLGPSAGKVTLPRASHGCALQHRTGLHTRVATVVNPFIPACLCRSTPGARPEPPNGAILRVPTDVTAMQVTTSDGVIQTVQIVRHPVHQNALVGALVYPPDTQITTMTVADATGPYEVATTQPPSVTSAAQPPVNRLPDLPQMARSSSGLVRRRRAPRALVRAIVRAVQTRLSAFRPPVRHGDSVSGRRNSRRPAPGLGSPPHRAGWRPDIAPRWARSRLTWAGASSRAATPSSWEP